MAPSTRNQTAGNQQTKTKEQTTKQLDNNGIPKKGNAAKASKAAERTLNAAVDAYEKADGDQKAAIQDQLNVHQPMEKPVDMDVAEDNVESPAEQQMKKESDEGSIFVSPIEAGQDQPSQKAGGSPSDQEQSSREEKDPEPSGDNNQGKLPQPKVGFQNDLPTPPGAEDELDLVRANPLREIFHNGASQDEGWVRLAYGSAFDVERQGPPNAARFRFKEHNEELKIKSLDDVSHGIKTQLDGKKLYKRGDIIALRGVVWDSLKDLDHYSSLAPRNWKRTGTRTARPPMRILVKWAGKAAEGERWPEAMKWEKRDAVLRCWRDKRGPGNATVLCEEELRLGEVVLVEKGERLSLCDFVIVFAAYRCEKRFREWETEQRPGRDRSPTPGLPLKDEKQSGGGESPDVKAQVSQSAKEPESTEAQADSTH